MPTSLYPLLDTLQLFYDTKACLLICTQESCKFALSNGPSQVVAHLRDKHNIPTEARKGLHRLLKSLSPKLLDPNKALLPADGSARHDKLQVYEGFACLNCPFRTISIQLMRRHQSSPPEGCSSGVSHTRSLRRRDLDQQFECVYLQTWTTGSTRKYWIIKRGGSIVRQVDSPAVQAHLRGVLTREFSRQQPNPDTMTTTAPAPSAGMTAFALQTPWLDRTGWDRTYSNKGGQEYFVGSGKVYGLEDDIVSPGEDEDRIACLVRLVDVVMSRCDETARKTSRHILCWLRSNQASSIYGKPFTLVQSSSTSKYRLLLKRCLAMVCRIYRLHPDRRIKVAGLALSRKQLQFLDAIWTHEALGDLAALNERIGRHKCQVDHAQEVAGGHRESHSENTNTEGEEEDDDEEDEEESEKDEEEGEGEEEVEDSNHDYDHDQEVEEGSDKQENDGGFTAWLEDLGEITEEEDDQMEEEAGAARGSPEELVELLFGLTLAIATQPVINGQPQTTVLIYFSGILGFSLSPGGGAFLPARSYTSNLSGLVYILRLVLLEYALPLRAYPTLALQRRPRMGQLKRLQPIRRQYMVMESQSPMEELLSLRNYGQVISRSDTPAYLLRWSANGQAVSFGDKISISMGQFRRLPEHFIKEAARLCNEMMFSWDPVINLSNITDDMTNNKEGFSFVLHPKNKLDTAYLELLHRTSRAHRNSLVHGGNWDWNAIFQYFKRDEALLSAILGGMFCTGGQLPRCTEVLSLLCCNGELHPRAIPGDQAPQRTAEPPTMSTLLARIVPLKPEIRLAQAIKQFEMDLSDEQKAAFHSNKRQSCHSPPNIHDVMRLTAEIDRRVAGNVGGGRCFGTRLVNVLEAVQQFAALGDIVVGGSQNMIACGVWSLVRMTLLMLVNASSWFDKLSELFMTVGRSAPRYQAMTLLYPRSRKLQSYLSEYFLVVVRICHDLLKLTRKSMFAQFVSLMTESDMSSYRSDFDLWANAIKEEMNLLMAQQLQEQSRHLVSISKTSGAESYRKKLEDRHRILNSCSTYDYQTTWKEIRRCGNTSWFTQQREYQDWKGRSESCTLLYSGGLGSGKSISLANMVDDLNLNRKDNLPVAYFFCRHDVPEGNYYTGVTKWLHRRHSYTGVAFMASDSLFFPSTHRYIHAKAVKAAPLTSPRFW
ncbi:hypothetical protein BFJ69_g16636 [Fusarium oxysporum]|uniref:Nephrocystin 3-like N-terminal domain-containing protein n=1 Tax=Fusarium oxysporum TaxID=5507 RepID=A0A420MAL6_FUSOX|nr:hypothetical protein BFJ69_g16636 [Fusarium oxysporum]